MAELVRDFAAGLIGTGLYQSNSAEVPTAKDLHHYFVGWLSAADRDGAGVAFKIASA